MEDNRFKDFKYCEVVDVYKKLPSVYNTYLIQIKVKKDKNDMFGEYHNVYIDCHNLSEEITKLINVEKERLYLSHYMANIDIFKDKSGYVIENSPSDASFKFYYLSKKEFDKIILAVTR